VTYASAIIRQGEPSARRCGALCRLGPGRGEGAAADADAKRRAGHTRTLQDRGVVSGEQADADRSSAVARQIGAGPGAARRHGLASKGLSGATAPFDGVVLRLAPGRERRRTAATPVVEIAAASAFSGAGRHRVT
jgi:hypothetical protein